MNEIAILIIAHKDQAQLECLIESLNSDFALYVHIDIKSNIDVTDLKNKFQNVNIYSECDVRWGSLSLVQCSLLLFKEANKNKHSYYILISGQDLPIVSNDKIIEYLTRENCSFVVSDKLPLPQWKYNGGFDRIQLYWESDIIGNSLLAKLKRKVIAHVRKRQRLNQWKKRPLYPNLEYHGGSNWIILKDDAMSYLLDFINKHPKYLKSFKNSFCSDEIWMQTILATSGCKMKNEHFTYLDWSKGPEHPRTLRSDDYTDIINSPYLFARKFDPDVDSEVIRKIQEHRNKA